MSSSNSRSGAPQTTPFLRLGLERSELKSIKVAITRRNVSETMTSGPLLRSLDDPAELVVHYRPDEGVRPIFDREDVLVNKEDNEERTILADKAPNRSRSSSRSTRSSPVRAPPKGDEKSWKRPSPQPHSSRGRSREDYRDREYTSSRFRRSRSHSRKAVYKSSSPPRSGYRRSKSPRRSPDPGRYNRPKTPPKYYSKRHSRSPHKERRRSRSPPPRPPDKYRGPPERRRSRSPPPRSRGRSRSYSPHRRRYDRPRRSRSRSPRRRDDVYETPRIPHPYFEGAEFWVPNPLLQPRFIPRQMIPPGAFPYPFRPGLPPMMPPRMPFRPRIVYNSGPQRPRSTPTTSAAGDSSVVTTTSGRNDEGGQSAVVVECTDENDPSSEAKSE